MFSGIVEAQSLIQKVSQVPSGLAVELKKPSNFNDISIGDSIAVDGVCLTVEAFGDQFIEFILAAETLQVTKWKSQDLQGRSVNLERSLVFGNRVHGHLVTGHVDARVSVLERIDEGGSVILWIEIPSLLKRWIWRKGCVSLNGTSLTVNDVIEDRFSICLIPETLRRTNLANLNQGDELNIETDYLAKSLANSLERNSEGLK